MRRLSCLLAFALAGGLLPLGGAEDEVVFRSDVSLVRVDAQVVDSGNRAITGLRSIDFILREEGKLQPIRSFASENMPVDVLLLFDVSASMRPHIQRIADAADRALRVMGQQDRVGIMVFDRYSRTRLPFDKRLPDVRHEMDRLLDEETFHGGTDITRALYDAANYVRREARIDARRAIVIVTDDETEFRKDVDGVSRALTRADAVLCLILAPDAMRYRNMGGGGGGYPQGGGYPPGGGIGGPLGGIILGRPRGPYGGRGGGGVRGPRTQSAGTAEIARRSGGDSMPIDDSYSFESTLARIRQRYALYFNVPEAVRGGEERQIEVALADATRSRYPGAEVRYRKVYMTPSAGGRVTDSQPPVISRAPVGGTSNAEAPPARRPRVVMDDSGRNREGPLDIEGSQPTQSDAPASAPVIAAPPPPRQAPGNSSTADPDPPGGWRRARPDEK